MKPGVPNLRFVTQGREIAREATSAHQENRWQYCRGQHHGHMHISGRYLAVGLHAVANPAHADSQAFTPAATSSTSIVSPLDATRVGRRPSYLPEDRGSGGGSRGAGVTKQQVGRGVGSMGA